MEKCLFPPQLQTFCKILCDLNLFAAKNPFFSVLVGGEKAAVRKTGLRRRTREADDPQGHRRKGEIAMKRKEQPDE